MSEFSAADYEWMARALNLATRGKYSCPPNPQVGCVLVREGQLVGEGYHARAGEAHAEINALQSAGSNADGAAAYVTLEPCSHQGRTPPCVNALIEAGVSRVIIAMKDPDPRVDGTGIGLLMAAGIAVETGLLAEEARALNEGFVSRMERQRPFVRLKIAASIDGRTAMSTGESQWITDEKARLDVHRLRAAAGAIVTGVNTVSTDDPSLTVRGIDSGGRQPIRVVLDSALRTPPEAKLLSEPGDTYVYCADDRNAKSLQSAGATIVAMESTDGRVDPGNVLDDLASREINDVLVECGPVLAGSFITAGLVDEIILYQAPHLMGSETRGMLETPAWSSLSERMPIIIRDVRSVGTALRVTMRPASANSA